MILQTRGGGGGFGQIQHLAVPKIKTAIGSIFAARGREKLLQIGIEFVKLGGNPDCRALIAERRAKYSAGFGARRICCRLLGYG